jgi:hypothetical protein
MIKKIASNPDENPTARARQDAMTPVAAFSPEDSDVLKPLRVIFDEVPTS